MSGRGVTIRGVLYLPPEPRRRVVSVYLGQRDRLAVVVQGETTPWAWASAPRPLWATSPPVRP